MARNRPIAGQRTRAHLGVSSPTERRTAAADGGARLGKDPAPARTADGTRHGRSTTRLMDRPAAEPASAAPAERTRTWLLAALLVLTLIALTTFAVVAYRVRTDARVETARDQAVAAAQSNAVTILSYDYRHLSKDFAAARKVLTGSFANDYTATTSKMVRPGAQQYHVVVRAEVAAVSVVSASVNQVVVLLFVNQTTTSTRLDGPRVDLNRVRLTLVKVDGHWLVSKVVAL
jgi:Mce-associated membrane protein